jgi:hypothetical protein
LVQQYHHAYKLDHDDFCKVPPNLEPPPPCLRSSQFYLALLIITPWLLALAYDLLLYTWRSLTYDIPVVGGRARGVNPPRAPTLTERTDGATRTPPVDLAEQVAARAEEVVYGTEGAPVTQKLRRRAEKVLKQTD